MALYLSYGVASVGPLTAVGVCKGAEVSQEKCHQSILPRRQAMAASGTRAHSVPNWLVEEKDGQSPLSMGGSLASAKAGGAVIVLAAAARPSSRAVP